MNNDFLLELFNALLIAGIILYQLVKTRNTGLYGRPGTKLILAGFCFMLFGACLDMTDEFPQLGRFVVIGDTPVEAFLEKFFGYILGSFSLLLGFSRILPVFAELEGKQHLIETMVETIPAPTFCKDADGRYLLCNRAFEEFIGFPRQQIIGQTVFAVAPTDCAEVYQRADLELLASRGKQTYETQIETAEGLRRDVLFHKAVFSNEDGSAGGLVGVILDISARKRVEDGLRDLDRMKSEFISIAAHEFRTPLTSIQGYTELLLSDAETGRLFDDAQRRDFLQEINRASETLSKLVDELLDVGRIEQGLPLPLDLQPHQPELLLQKIITQFCLQDPDWPITLTSNLPPQCSFLFDAHRLRQLVENLLSNAIKYSPEQRPIDIEARVVGESFQLEVRDQGVGMTAEQQVRIFDKFYRANHAQNNISGLGIGMSIVKSVVEAHSGQIEIESQPAQGTCVRVSLPMVGA